MANKTARMTVNAATKAWATRRKNAAKTVKASTTRAPRATSVTMRTTSNSRTLSLEGTRKLRASVPTLVGHLNSAKSVDYYYSAGRSVVVINS